MNRQVLQIAVGSVVLIGAFYFGSLAQKKHGDLVTSSGSSEPLANEDLVWHTQTTRHEIGTARKENRGSQVAESLPAKSGSSSVAPGPGAGSGPGVNNPDPESLTSAEPNSPPVRKIVQPDFSRFANSASEVSLEDSSAPRATPLLPIENALNQAQTERQPVIVSARKPPAGEESFRLPDSKPQSGSSSADWPLGSEVPDLLPKRRPADGSVLEQPSQLAPTDLVPFSLNRDAVEIDTETFRVHVVRTGDTLQSLARQYYGKADYYLDIYLANQDGLDSPLNLPVGKPLKIPEYSTRGR